MKKSLVVALSLVLAMPSFAKTPVGKHVVVAPKCLLRKVTTAYESVVSIHNFSLITTDDKGIDGLVDAKTVRNKHKAVCGGFMDVTDAWDALNADTKDVKQAKAFLNSYIPNDKHPIKHDYRIQYTKETTDTIAKIKPDAMWADLKKLTSFPDRSGRTDYGVKAAEWIKNRFEDMAKASGHQDVTVYYVPTGNNYIQPSVVAKLGDSTESAVVIGGHMDTLSSTFELKPGADDDGSGSVTVLGVARAILNSGLKFKHPIYFVWYSAEEVGLVGSYYVVKDFIKKDISVDSVIQFDMTGYKYQNDPTMWLMTDNVDTDLTNFLGSLIETYVKQPYKKTRCGYACSDHASWHQEGFRSSMPFETAMGNDDPYIHTVNDKMEYVSLDHITDFAKLGVAFAVELGEPV